MYDHMRPDHRIMNRPIPLVWGGWKSDTYTLMDMGWLLSAHQDVQYRTMQLAIKHPDLRVQGISNLGSVEYRSLLDGHNWEVPFSLIFENMASTIYINMPRNLETKPFKPIDARPTYMESVQIKCLDDFAHFQELAIEVPKNEVYLKEANMSQILEMALQRQEPEQERIRAELLQQQDLRKMRQGQLHTELRLVA